MSLYESKKMVLKQFLVTPAAGKRLIGLAMTIHPIIQDVLKSGTLVIIAGTTNGYVAEEILKSIGSGEGFSKKHFFRGITQSYAKPTSKAGKLPDQSEFEGDVIIVNGKLQRNLTIFDVIDKLKEGDVILKGANALNLTKKKAAVFIAHPKAGTIGATLQAVTGRRVRLIIPVGLEKRVISDLDGLSLKLNTPGAQGPRLLPVPGQVFTEIDAISLLTGAIAELVAGGGVCGAEGGIWLAVSGETEQVKAAETLVKSVRAEPLFDI